MDMAMDAITDDDCGLCLAHEALRALCVCLLNLGYDYPTVAMALESPAALLDIEFADEEGEPVETERTH